MLRYLQLYAQEEGTTDTHLLLKEMLEKGGVETLKALARLAPGRKEFRNLLPTLRQMLGAYWLGASWAAERRRRLSRTAADRLNLYLWGVRPKALRRLVRSVSRLADEIEMVNASAIASPVWNVFDVFDGADRCEDFAADFERLPRTLERYSDALRKLFAERSNLRLPSHFDVATAQEAALVLEVRKSTGAPQHGAVSMLCECLYQIAVPVDLRRYFKREFDEKSFADRCRRFRRSAIRLQHLERLTDLLEEIEQDILFGGFICPQCGKQSIHLGMIHPVRAGEQIRRRTHFCATPNCGYGVNTVEVPAEMVVDGKLEVDGELITIQEPIPPTKK